MYLEKHHVWLFVNSNSRLVWDLWIIALLIYWVAYGIGYILSVFLTMPSAQLAVCIVVLLSSICSGSKFVYITYSSLANPRLPEFYEMPFPFPYLPALSYMRWGKLFLSKINHVRNGNILLD